MIGNLRLLFLLLLASSLIISCYSGGEKDSAKESVDAISPEATTQEEEIRESNYVMFSPVEIAAFLKKYEIKISEDVLCGTNNANNFLDNFKKALGLGIYGADLAFINFYGEYELMPRYMETVARLSDGLRITGLYDNDRLKSLIDEKQELDSIIYLTTRGFQDLTDQLRETDRENIRILIFIGGWIESLHIVANAADTKDLQKYLAENSEFVERIGSQKDVLNEIVGQLNAFKSNPQYASLLTMFNDLQEVYSNVEIDYKLAEPEIHESDDAITIVDKSTSTVNVTHENIVKIINKINDIRTELISP